MAREIIDFLLSDALPAHSAQEDVGVNGAAAQHFGETARASVALEIHLPEAILSVDKALRKKEIVLGAGIDVGNAHFVANDVYWGIQAGQNEFSFDLRIGLKRGFGNVEESGDDKQSY